MGIGSLSEGRTSSSSDLERKSGQRYSVLEAMVAYKGSGGGTALATPQVLCYTTEPWSSNSSLTWRAVTDKVPLQIY